RRTARRARGRSPRSAGGAARTPARGPGRGPRGCLPARTPEACRSAASSRPKTHAWLSSTMVRAFSTGQVPPGGACPSGARITWPSRDRHRFRGPNEGDGAMNLREQKKIETRERILHVAHVLFHARGFEATTLEDICAEVPISKRTFFRYFPDKE